MFPNRFTCTPQTVPKNMRSSKKNTCSDQLLFGVYITCHGIRTWGSSHVKCSSWRESFLMSFHVPKMHKINTTADSWFSMFTPKALPLLKGLMSWAVPHNQEDPWDETEIQIDNVEILLKQMWSNSDAGDYQIVISWVYRNNCVTMVVVSKILYVDPHPILWNSFLLGCFIRPPPMTWLNGTCLGHWAKV